MKDRERERGGEKERAREGERERKTEKEKCYVLPNKKPQFIMCSSMANAGI